MVCMPSLSTSHFYRQQPVVVESTPSTLSGNVQAMQSLLKRWNERRCRMRARHWRRGRKWDCRSYSIIINLARGLKCIFYVKSDTELNTWEYIDIYVCVIYRTRNVLEIEFYPSWNIYWNILKSHFFIAVRTLFYLFMLSLSLKNNQLVY